MMKMKRRAMGVALLASLLGGFLVGCGGSGPAGGVAAVKPAPRVAQSAESALCLNGTFTEGPFNTWVGKLSDFALRNIPEDAAKDLTEAGILGKKLRWAVLSAGKLPAEDTKKGLFPMAKIPPFALAVSFDHDAAKIAAVLERMTKGPGGASSVSKTTVEGLPAWEVAVMGNLLKDRFHPCFTSLDDGKTLLVASLAPGLAEQVRLYRSGEGCAKEGFEAITGLRTSNIALLQTCALGPLVAQYVDAKTLKDFGQMVGISNFADIVAGLRKAELGLALSSGDVDLVLTLNAETASAATQNCGPCLNAPTVQSKTAALKPSSRAVKRPRRSSSCTSPASVRTIICSWTATTSSSRGTSCATLPPVMSTPPAKRSSTC